MFFTMEVFRPVRCAPEDYKKLIIDAAKQEGKPDQRFKSTKTKVKVVIDGKEFEAVAAFILDVVDKIVWIDNEQIKHFSDQKYTSITCAKIPNLSSFIRDQAETILELPYTTDSKKPLFLPMNKSVAAGIILTFFNGTRDPMDKIRSMFGTDLGDASDDIGRLLATYYICCLKYTTDIDLGIVLEKGKNEHLLLMLDDRSCIPTLLQEQYRELKSKPAKIPQGMVAFHAVYGAYVLCRPVANKQEFRNWISKRYNAFLSSIQHATETGVYLELQAGGNKLNALALSRPSLRRAAYQVIKEDTKTIVHSAIKNHIRMLTALSEMTTYALIQKVIATGGSVMMIKPLPSQIAKFIDEKKEVEALLEEEGYSKDEIIYIHLIMPNLQCFRSAQYADLIVTANEIEAYNEPRNHTLERYKAKTEGATICVKTVRLFLAEQSKMATCGVDEETKAKLRELFGASLDEIIKDAERVVKVISKQGRSD